MHGGELGAHSPGLGRGSTFTVRLPVGVSAPATAGAAAAPAIVDAGDAASAGRQPQRILVADDNHDAADSLALLLGLVGHEVEVAYDGQEALDRYRSFRPQLALLDMAMPRYSGAEVAALIRTAHGDAAITLVALTGFGQERDRHLALEAGFDHHLTKPVQLDQLLVLIGGERLNGTEAEAAHAGASGIAQ
jgi:CheY-like chemotaxis protein